MNFPPAPVSNNALVLTVLSFGLLIEIEIRSDIDLFTISAMINFEIVMEGMADVKAGSVTAFNTQRFHPKNIDS